ncbi:hypothetical protein O3P69_011574 [Scylla paramamosain]|uniref:Uncharacterized protein n=1 Tax=Scylla paramamosain TaxID=85552 RepID=A0AAW0T681_SCYPA
MCSEMTRFVREKGRGSRVMKGSLRWAVLGSGGEGYRGCQVRAHFDLQTRRAERGINTVAKVSAARSHPGGHTVCTDRMVLAGRDL